MKLKREVEAKLKALGEFYKTDEIKLLNVLIKNCFDETHKSITDKQKSILEKLYGLYFDTYDENE